MISLDVFDWHESNFHLMGVTRDPLGHIGPKRAIFGPNWGHKRTSRTLNRDLKVTKQGPNDQPGCI